MVDRWDPRIGDRKPIWFGVCLVVPVLIVLSLTFRDEAFDYFSWFTGDKVSVLPGSSSAELPRTIPMAEDFYSRVGDADSSRKVVTAIFTGPIPYRSRVKESPNGNSGSDGDSGFEAPFLGHSKDPSRVSGSSHQDSSEESLLSDTGEVSRPVSGVPALSAVLIDVASIDSAFTADRSRFPGGDLQLINRDNRPCFVSFHGEGSSFVLVDGIAVQPGESIPVLGTITITFGDRVGIHIRSTGSGRVVPHGEG